MLNNRCYFILLALNLIPQLIAGFAPAVPEQIHEHEMSSTFETEIKLEELHINETPVEKIREFGQEYVKDSTNFKEILDTTEPLSLIKNVEEKRALAFIEMPQDNEIPILTFKEKQFLKELFQTHLIKRHGDKLIIAFTYQHEDLLPETKEQAIYLLLAAYYSDQDKVPNELQKNGILNEKQASALDKKEYNPHPFKPMGNQKLKVTNARTHEGLSGSTRVKTSTGYSSLKDLQVGDMVACFDPESKQILYSPVTHTDKIQVQQHVVITLNGKDIKVAPQHEFYATALNEWVTAAALLNDANLCSYVSPEIQNVQLVNDKLDVIRITVNSHHNFFITDNNILVHNYIPIVIELAIAFEIGQEIALTWAILAPTAMAIATGLFYWITDKFVHDTPRDLIFTPGPMQDYSQFFGDSNVDVKFYSHGYVENSNHTHTKGTNNHKNPQNSSDKPRAAHNEATKSSQQPKNIQQKEASVTADPPPLDPKKPDREDKNQKEEKENLNKKDGIKESPIYKKALNAIEKNIHRFEKLRISQLSKSVLKHVINNHYKIGEVAKRRTSNSIFNENIDLIDTILTALELGTESEPRVITYDCGKIIGTSLDGTPTSIIKVCLHAVENMITSVFPG